MWFYEDDAESHNDRAVNSITVWTINVHPKLKILSSFKSHDFLSFVLLNGRCFTECLRCSWVFVTIPRILNSCNSLMWGTDQTFPHEVVFSKCGQIVVQVLNDMGVSLFWVSCSFKTVLLSSILEEWLALLTPLDEICLSETASSAASHYTGQCLVSKLLCVAQSWSG